MLIFVQYYLHLNKTKKEKKMGSNHTKDKKEIKDLEIKLFEKEEPTKTLMIESIKALKEAFLKEED